MIAAHQTQQVRLPRIGVIRKGAPKSENAPGKDLDYFRLDRADKTVVEVWDAVLGREPQAISGVLPYADPAENLNIWDELWQGKRLLWRGDGERLHVQLQGNSYVRYALGEGPKQPAAAGESVDKGKVARISRLRLLLPQLRVAGIFEIASTSQIDADELWSNLMWIRQTVSTLQGAPVTVFRAARQFNVAKPNGTTMAVTKHMLHMVLDGRYIDSLIPVGGGLLPSPSTLPSGLPDMDDGLFDDDDPPAVTTAKHPATQPVIVQQAKPTVTDATLSDDELVMRDVSKQEFIATAAVVLDVDEAQVKQRLRALGYTAIPGAAENRLGLYRELREAIRADRSKTFVAPLGVAEAEQPALVDAATNGAYTE